MVSLRTPVHSHRSILPVPCEKHSWRGTGCSLAMTARTDRKNAPEETSSCDMCHKTTHDCRIGVSTFRCEDVLESDDLENGVGEVDDEELRAAENPVGTIHVCAGTKLASLSLAVAAGFV